MSAEAFACEVNSSGGRYNRSSRRNVSIAFWSAEAIFDS